MSALAAAVFVIANVTVVDANGVRPAQDVVVAGGRIQAVGARVRIPRGAERIDGAGRFLIPGLWDAHVHVVGEKSGEWLPRLAAHGVTAVRNMHAEGDDPLGECRQWRGRVARGEVVGPAVFYNGSMLDGPSPVFPSSVALGSVHHVARELDRLARGGASFVKTYDLLPREIFLEIAREARRRQLPLAGHVPVAVPIEEAVAAGLGSIEHLTGYFEAANPRREELGKRMQLAAGLWAVNRAFAAESMRNIHLQMAAAYDPALAEPLLELFRDKGTFHCPTLVALRRHGVDAALEAVGDLHRAGVKLLAGTDAGNEGIEPGASLHDELELLVEAGLTPIEALTSATLRPAEFFRLERSMGTIERGKVADLALLDADPTADIRNVRRVVRVWLRGIAASHHLEDQTLQVMRLRHGEQDRVIPGLGAPIEDAQRLARVERGLRHRLQQHGLAHVE